VKANLQKNHFLTLIKIRIINDISMTIDSIFAFISMYGKYKIIKKNKLKCRKLNIFPHIMIYTSIYCLVFKLNMREKRLCFKILLKK